MTIISNRVIMRLRILAMMGVVALLTSCVSEGPDVLFPAKYNLKQAGDDYVSLAYKYMEKGERESALSNIMKALEINSSNPKALDAMALFYQRDGEFEKAEQYFRKAISVDGSYTGGYLNYGQFLYSQARYKEACENFKTASDDTLYDQRASAFANLGTCYRALGDADKAEQSFNNALRIDSKNESALIELADLYFEQKKYSPAVNSFDRYTAVGKPTAHSLWLGIRLQRIFGNTDSEASLALQLKNLFPKSDEYLQYLHSQ